MSDDGQPAPNSLTAVLSRDVGGIPLALILCALAALLVGAAVAMTASP